LLRLRINPDEPLDGDVAVGQDWGTCGGWRGYAHESMGALDEGGEGDDPIADPALCLVKDSSGVVILG
jgi:hypothetical protein